MPAANTRECFNEFIGQRLVGMLFDALPLNRPDLSSGNRSMVFEDGRALTLADNGSYWIDTADEVQRAIRAKQKQLDATAREIADVLKLAGAAS